MPMTTKDAWRAWAREQACTPYSASINRNLGAWKPLSGTVLSYVAMSSEVDLATVHALARCRIAVTRTPAIGPLSVHEYVPNRIEYHRFGYGQPTSDAPRMSLDEIDVVLIPGLVFDRTGNRLGRGKGYYDELLRTIPRGTTRVGVTCDASFVDHIPVEGHDQRVAWVVTESGVHRTGATLAASTSRFVDEAIERGVAPDIQRFPAGTRTSQHAAAAVGSSLGEIAKSILFIVDGAPVLAVASGDCRIDETKLAAWAGGHSAHIAGLDEVKAITGYVAGGTPAVGLPKSVRVVADVGLARYRWVWSAGGTPDTVYPVALDRLISASGARWAEVTDRGKM